MLVSLLATIGSIFVHSSIARDYSRASGLRHRCRVPNREWLTWNPCCPVLLVNM